MFGTVWYRWAVPRYFYQDTGRFLPFLALGTILAWGVGLYGSVMAPADYQQGEGFRILYVHVPAAFLSLSIYAGMSVLALLVWVWKLKMADVLLEATSVVGACVTALALITGSLWGKPMWGTYWIWDARLTSELILWLMYVGVIAIRPFFSDRAQASKVCALLVLVGAIDLPIIHYSVEWWTTLHQGSTVRFLGPSLMDPQMLGPLWWMMGAYSGAVVWWVLLRGRVIVLREYGAQLF